MTSEKQILANRKNALASTGPCTITGKAVVSTNAIKHGIFTQKVVISEDEMDLFMNFFKTLFEQFVPANPIESILVERVVANAWRLRKIIEIESLFLSKESQKSIFNHSLMVQEQSNQNMITLSRYEQALEKSLFRSLQMLEKLKSHN